MSDRPNGGSGHLPGFVARWVAAVYGALGWRTPTDDSRDGRGPERSRRAALIAKLGSTNPAVTPPTGATRPERAAIERRRAKIVEDLQRLTDDTGLGPLLGEIAGLREDVRTVAARLEAEGLPGRESRGRALALRLATIATPAGAQPAEAKALAVERTAIAADLAAMAGRTDIPAHDHHRRLDALERRIDAFEAAAAALAGLIPKRQRAADAVATARAALGAAAGALDRGSTEHLRGLLGEAATLAGRPDADAGTCGEAVAKAGAVAAGIGPATAFAAALDRMRGASETYILFSIPAIDQPALRTRRDAAAEAARGLAARGRFSEAVAALDRFATDPGVTATDLDRAARFAARLARFRTTPGRDFVTVYASNLPGCAALRTRFDDAKTLAIEQQRYDDAIAEIDAVAAAVPGMLAYVGLHQSYALLEKKGGLDAPAKAQVTAALAAATRKAQAGDHAGAAGALSALDATLGAARDYTARRVALEKPVALFLAPATAPGRNAIAVPWQAAATEAAAGRVAEATAALARVETLLPVMEALRALDRDCAKAVLAADPTDAFGLLAPAAQHAAAGRYPEAVAALRAVLAAVPRLDAYRAELAAAGLLKETLGGTAVAERAEVQAAIDEATHIAATAQDFDAAAARLRRLTGSGTLAVRALEAAEYLALKAAVERAQARALAGLAPAGTTTPLIDGLAAAVRRGEAEKMPGEAIALLLAHRARVAAAADYAAERRRALRVAAALAAVAAGPPDSGASVYTARNAAQIAKAVTDAEDEATDGDFAAAAASLRALMQSCDAMCRAAAGILEALDGADSAAGHSIDRHGPDVPLDRLERRVLTGMAPDDRVSFTAASTRFESAADWLSARQQALEALTAANPGPPGSPHRFDPADTTLPLGAQLSFQTVIDHGKPIDAAFVGRKSNRTVETEPGEKSRGEVVDDRTFESTAFGTGLTRSFSNFVFVLAAVDGRRPRDEKDYVAAYKAANADAAPPHLVGRWVLMQQFPHVAGWDFESGGYAD